MPIIISHRVCLKEVKGKINIINNMRFGMIHIGFGDIGIFDRKKSRTIWQLSGVVNFAGKANIGHGSKISVSGELTIGNDCSIVAETSIICRNKVNIGNNTLISWDNLIMDSDQHVIISLENYIVNYDKEVNVGNNVWIGCRCTILKGSVIPNNSVVATNSLVNAIFNREHIIIGGNPANILKENITWHK
jgi:acetyltransferase-like isoleucine patch superfamily enzyme